MAYPKYNNSKSQENKKDFFEETTAKMIEAMQSGDKEWKRTWDLLGKQSPYNPITGTEYSGINRIALSFSGHQDPRYLTFKQASELGYQIKKGSKSHTIIHFQINEKEVENETTGEKEKIVIPSVRTWNVFNAEQIDGIPALNPDMNTRTFNEIKNVEELIKNSGANIIHGGDQPCYVPSQDIIRMPEKEQFHTPIDYYTTLLHETVHWTGHESRLDRLKDGGFASKSYAHEELIAELGSVFLSGKTGIPLNDDHYKHHAQYINGWITLLKEDKNALFKASSQAQKATDFVMQYSPERAYDIELIDTKTAVKVKEVAETPKEEPEVKQEQTKKKTQSLGLSM
jgi:antirestriction protein ArdC